MFLHPHYGVARSGLVLPLDRKLQFQRGELSILLG